MTIYLTYFYITHVYILTLTQHFQEQKSKKGRESLTIQNEAPTGPLVVGMAMLDLLPIFLGIFLILINSTLILQFIGATEFSQELYVRQVTKEFGEKAIAVADLPKLRVTITLDGPSIDVEKSCVMHISVESIFNIPSLLTPNYCYQLSIILPLNSDVRIMAYVMRFFFNIVNSFIFLGF